VQQRAISLVATIGLLVLVSCSSSSSSSSPQTSKKPAHHAPTHLSRTNPGCRFIVAGTGKRETTPGPELQYLTTPAAESFACYDRVSFQFSPAPAQPGAPATTTTTTKSSTAQSTCVPAYTVEYRKKPFGLVKPDGKPVNTSVGGFKPAKAVLYVEIQPAAAVSTYARHPELAYPGGLRLTFKQSDMHHVVMVEWVKTLPEGEQTASPTTTVPGAAPVPQRVVWLIGLDEKRPFTVDCSTGAVLGPDGLPRACPAKSCTHFNVLIMK